MPDPQKVLATIQPGDRTLPIDARVDGGAVTLDDSVEEVMVVGDLHGNIPAFRHVLIAADLANNPAGTWSSRNSSTANRHYPDDGGTSRTSLSTSSRRSSASSPTGST